MPRQRALFVPFGTSFLYARRTSIAMYRLPRSVKLCHGFPVRLHDRKFCSSVVRKKEPLTGSEPEKLNRSHIIAASIGQPQVSTSHEIEINPQSIGLLDPATQVSETFDVPSTPGSFHQATADKTPRPFEDIPGPAVLKLWEKYWKYVPLLGTQLFCSLLTNRFTQGRLHWNRNVTPLKYLFNEYGCIVRIHGPIAGNVVMIHRHEHIAHVLNQEGDVPIRSGIDILQHYRLHHKKYRMAGGYSLQGAEWLEVKKNVEKPFNEIVSDFFRKLDICCDEMIGRIRAIRNEQDEVPSNFHQEMTRWCMECFSSLVFNKRLGFLDPAGQNPGSEPHRIINALATANTYMSRCETGFQVWRFFETPFAKKLFAACDVLDGVIGKYICQVQNKMRYEESYDKNNESDGSSPIIEKLLLHRNMSAEDISTLLMDMIILGVQATTSCQGFLLYFLARNPRVQRKLFEEIASVLPTCDAPLTMNALQNMHYLKACMQESLRLRPAFPYITRLLPETITLHGYTIPKGTFVIMASQIASQREENFEDPLKFKPERWLTSQSDEDYQEYSFLPFGRGLRSCLGKSIAETEMLLLTAKIVREFRIVYDYADIKSRYSMVNVPNKPLRFRFVDRHS